IDCARDGTAYNRSVPWTIYPERSVPELPSRLPFRPLAAVACTLAFLLSAARCPADDPKDKARPLIWAADAEGGAPYIFKDPKDPTQYLGFEKDIADALARELGRRIEFKQYEYENLIVGLERGDFDFAMNGLEITADRKTKVRFSRPYYIYKLQLVA